jgi:hypothetical protein
MDFRRGHFEDPQERLETLLEAFPGAIETSAMRALSLWVTHLERLGQLVTFDYSKTTV